VKIDRRDEHREARRSVMLAVVAWSVGRCECGVTAVEGCRDWRRSSERRNIITGNYSRVEFFLKINHNGRGKI
jgi:hypothetical protein